MNRIETKVHSARRRIILGRFGHALCVTLFAALIVATLAIALPALRVMDIDFNTWVYAWIGGCSLAALIAAGAIAAVTAPSLESVATEVDKRFGLRERLSSSLTLGADEKDTAFGMALAADADKRAGQLEVADRFQLKPTKLGWLPVSIIPVLAIVLLLVEPMSQSSASSAGKADAVEVKQVQTVTSQLKKRIQQQRRKAESEGLKEAQEMYEKMEAELDKIAKRENMNRKDAMIAMNDLKKQLEERRDQLGSSEQMRRALSQMKGIDAGPGEKVAKSIEQGNFGQAKEMVKQLASKMRDGKLSEKEKEQLKKQVEQMKQALQKAVQEHQQKKQDLQQKIEEARKEGRGDDAAKMQQQLNQLQQKDSQMQQMQQMAEAMNQAAKAMQQGDGSQAADALEQMAEQLGEMQQEMSELEDLQSAMDQLSQSKNQMRCEKCGGGGCEQCQGMGMQGFGNGMGEGDGFGRGSGFGDRPEQEEDTNTYETQVRGQVKKGSAIIAGFADGPNKKGVSREDLKQAIQGALSEESDPTENQTLPRTEREHAQQYFDQLREGT
jgi:septal ring factor EnvC (AmiA/AmiB activator)